LLLLLVVVLLVEGRADVPGPNAVKYETNSAKGYDGTEYVPRLETSVEVD